MILERTCINPNLKFIEVRRRREIRRGRRRRSRSRSRSRSRRRRRRMKKSGEQKEKEEKDFLTFFYERLSDSQVIDPGIPRKRVKDPLFFTF